MIKKFFNEVSLFFSNIKQIKKDKENRELFINDLKQEIIDPASTYNKLKLQSDENYTHISCIVNLPENYQLASTDIDKYRKLNELVRPVNKYLVQELNWGEYFVNPDFYYIDTNVDLDKVTDEISCSYIATWRYSPILNKYPNFKYQLGVFIGVNATLIAGIILAIILL